MERSNLKDICYARISTNNKHQRSSLDNQCIALKKLRGNKVILFHKVHSGENDFPEELKNKILELKKKNNEIRLNVFAFDRLTRNLRDLDFVYQNVKYLYVIGNNREYDVTNELKEITINVLNAIQEVAANRNRANTHANYNRLSGHKRFRDNETEKEHEKIFDNNGQCLSISNNLKNNGIPNGIIKTMEEFIRSSQNLDSLSKWNKIFIYAKNLGLDVQKMKKDYEKCLKEYTKNNKPVYKMDKNDIVKLIVVILKKYNMDNNIFTNKFVSCNIKMVE